MIDLNKGHLTAVINMALNTHKMQRVMMRYQHKKNELSAYPTPNTDYQ